MANKKDTKKAKPLSEKTKKDARFGIDSAKGMLITPAKKNTKK